MKKLVLLPFCAAFALLLLLAGDSDGAPRLSKKEIKKLKISIAKAMQDDDWETVRSGLDKLSSANNKKTWKLIAKVVSKAPRRYEHDMLMVVRKAAQTMSDKGVQRELPRTLRSSRSRVVKKALIIHLANKKQWKPLIPVIKDKDEQVAALAVYKLAAAQVEEAVEPMIAAFEKLEKTRAGIWDVLRNQLGKLLGGRSSTAIEYRSRWEIVKEKGGLSKVAPPKDAPPSRGAMRSGVRLFGRDIDCTRVVFILDVSGSMSAIDPDQHDYDDEDLTTSVRKKRGPGSGLKKKRLGKTRLQRAQKALKRVIKNLPARYKINIVAYSSRVKIWRANDGDNPPKLHDLNAKNRADACKFVDSFKADGVTATDTALLRAYEVDGARCFYLLSDGFATHDGTTPVPTDEILDVLKKHKDRHVAVHTMGFKGADRAMMKAVAKASNGKYSDIK